MIQLPEFIQFLKQQCHCQPQNSRILVAYSAGVDSAVLCHLLHQAQAQFAIIHCNFQLRNELSTLDQQTAQKTANQYNVPFFTTNFDTQQYASQHQISIQLAARKLRYLFFETIRKKHQYHLIATAHHQSDNTETMLYNLAKGTGIAGLHGILPHTPKKHLIRPLLFTSKNHILEYAHHHQLQWNEDHTNTQTKYTRNFIRHKIVPLLQKINPNLHQTCSNTAQHIAEAEMIYQKAVQLYIKKLTQHTPKNPNTPIPQHAQNQLYISIARLQKMPFANTILYEILKPYNFLPAQIPQILSATNAQAGKYFNSNTHQLLKDRHFFILLPKKNETPPPLTYIHEPNQLIDNQIFKLKLETQNANGTFSTQSHIASFDLQKIKFPLILRTWQQGDYFYPLGMNKKKKKVARFFIDLKLNKPQKENTWILTDSQNRILWILNHRTDDRFKITQKTQNLLIATIF